MNQAEPALEPTIPTGTSGGVSGEEQAARAEADCRLVIYVAQENMTRQKAKAFSELLADMIRTMEDPSWTEGSLRNAALDHLSVPRFQPRTGHSPTVFCVPRPLAALEHLPDVHLELMVGGSDRGHTPKECIACSQGFVTASNP